MVVRKRKKVTKYRAHTTHGGGHRKKRRGAGSRGGRGRAGTGKRAGQKVAGGNVITGKSGFRPRRMAAKSRGINVGEFTSHFVEKLVAAGKATKEGNAFVIDLGSLGYTKLLGTGTPAVAVRVTVGSSSARATEKIEAAGGSVNVAGKSTDVVEPVKLKENTE